VPAWTADVLTYAGPLLAFSGAALSLGSVIHPHNLSVPRSEHALRRWAWLTAVRVGYFLALVSGGLAALVDRSCHRRRAERAERAVVPTRAALRPLWLSLRGGGGGRALGLLLAPFGLGLAALFR
jgi:hypothetical protein